MRAPIMLIGVAALCLLALNAPAQTAFTYQGELADAGTPAEGLHDFRFRLYDAVGTQVGPTLCADNVSVSGGRFTVTLDFGAVFTSAARSLEIEARADTGLSCSNLGGFTILSPRQDVTPAPKATHALTADTLAGQTPAFYQNAGNLTGGTLPSARFSGAYTGVLSFTNTANTFFGSGAGLTNLSASNLTTGILPIARGGTGASDAATARSSLGVPGLLVANTFNANQSLLLTTDTVGLIIRPAAGAVSDLQQWRNSGNVNVTRITSAGELTSTGTVRAAAFGFPAPQTRTLSVSMGQFAPSNGFFDYDNNGSRVRGLTSGQTCTFVAGITLPQGATVTAVRLHAQDNGPGTAEVIMYRQSLTNTGGFTAMGQISTTSAVAGIRTFSDTAITEPLVDNTQFQYHLYLWWQVPTPASSLDVWGVRVEYTVDGL